MTLQKYCQATNQLERWYNNKPTTQYEEVRALEFFRDNFEQVQVNGHGECLIISLYYALLFCHSPESLTAEILTTRVDPISKKWSDLRKQLVAQLDSFYSNINISDLIDQNICQQLGAMGTADDMDRAWTGHFSEQLKLRCITCVQTSTQIESEVTKADRYGTILILLLSQRSGLLGDFVIVKQKHTAPFGLDIEFYQAPAQWSDKKLPPSVFVLDSARSDRSSHFCLAFPTQDFFHINTGKLVSDSVFEADKWNHFKSIRNIVVRFVCFSSSLFV
jgi:hypothetical protein